EVAHLADENDVGIFTQRRTQRGGERRSVAADLDLLDDRFVVAMLELDRIFDRDDVALVVAIDLADERGERRRFSGAGRTADEHESARRLHQLRERGWQVELLLRRDLSRQR